MYTGVVRDIDPFVCNRNNGIFDNIQGFTYNGDNMFTATIRALLFDRIKENEKFIFEINSVYDNGYEEDEINERTIWFKDCIDNHNLYIIDFRYKKLYEQITTDLNFLSLFNDYENNEKWEKYTKAKFKTDCKLFINNDRTVILVNGLSFEFYKILIAFIPVFIPKYFKEKQLTDLEKSFIMSVIENTMDDYNKYAKQISEEKKIAAAIKDNLISKLFSTMKENKTNVLELQNKENKIKADSYIKMFNELMEKIEENNILIAGIRYMNSKNDENEHELKDYLKTHNNIKVINVTNEAIYIVVTSYLDQYDAEGYAKYSKMGNIFQSISSTMSDRTDAKLLFDKIFSEDPMFRIKVCSNYNLNLKTCTVSALSHCNYRSLDIVDYLPNPHIDYHSCIGGHVSPIVQYLRNGDIVGAIDQCVSSARSVNVHELGVTFCRMLKEIYTDCTGRKYIEDFEGNGYTAKEAIQKIKTNAIQKNENAEELKIPRISSCDSEESLLF